MAVAAQPACRRWSRRCARPAPRRSASTSSSPSLPPTPAADTALAAALGPDVTLAGDETLIRTPQADQAMRVEPLPQFLAAGAKVGIASVVLDNDGTLRRVPRYPDGFAAVLARSQATRRPRLPRGALLQDVRAGADLSDGLLLSGAVARRVPAQGFLARPRGHRRPLAAIGASMSQRAAPIRFATSYTLRSRQLVSGAEIQATIYENITQAPVHRQSASPWLLAGLHDRRRLARRARDLARHRLDDCRVRG